jgi:hypothetical protein
LQDKNALSDGVFGINNQQSTINLDTVKGFTNVTDQGESCYCLIDDEVMRIRTVIDLTGTIVGVVTEPSGAFSAVFPATWSGADNFYQGLQIAFTDGPRKGQSRTILQYDGTKRKAVLDGTQSWNVARGWNFTIRALQVDRGSHGSGTYPPIVVLGTVIILGKVHNQYAQVYFTSSQYPIFPDYATWIPSSGTLQANLIADWPLGLTLRAFVPVANPPTPQAPARPITVEVGMRQRLADGTFAPYTKYLQDFVTADPVAIAASAAVQPLLVCSPGTRISPGLRNCTACAVGQYSDACAGPVCLTCPAASYSRAAGQTACAVCSVGYACPGGSDQLPCPPGAFSDGSASACAVCPPRSYCPGATASLACPPGTSNGRASQSACANCPPGNIAAEEGAAACAACPPGAYAGSPGSTRCTLCPAGAFSNSSGTSACGQCPPDLYQPQGGSTACLRCPANTGARWFMGVCTGACGGSRQRGDCVCKEGFTDFGVAGAQCAAVRIDFARAGQNTACAAKRNLVTVTFSANARLTTAVQEVRVVRRGRGYVPGRLAVDEDGGRYFAANFSVDGLGSIAGITISIPGRGYSGNPKAVRALYPPACAVNASGCEGREQGGTIAAIRIVSPGIGYVPGRIVASGGGGVGCRAAFDSYICDANLVEGCAAAFGTITAVAFAAAQDHGAGYSSPPTLVVVYPGPVRCDAGGAAAVPRVDCTQEGTITTLRFLAGRTGGCGVGERIFAVGGGGAGFEARVVAVSPFGRLYLLIFMAHLCDIVTGLAPRTGRFEFLARVRAARRWEITFK